jgi:murein DD-endopeptidase MepM/ murein hydrolase activator NlpD
VESAQPLNRRQVLAALAGTGLGVAAAPRAFAQAPPPASPMELDGKPQQCGFVIGRTSPGAKVVVDGQMVGAASANGLFIVGFDRDAPASASVAVDDGRATVARNIVIAPGDYDIQRIDGLPQDQVTPTDPALLARIAAEAQRKAVGFASNIDADYFRDGFAWPVQYTRISARFGGQRILNGVAERPHYGIDLAAPIGAPIVAPGAGQVCFAETGLHYEGGLVMIDHGQGLVSMYLHMSRVDVASGQMLSRGMQIGAVGMEGRATGPHCCWRMKWRGRNMDPSLLVEPPFPPVAS